MELDEILQISISGGGLLLGEKETRIEKIPGFGGSVKARGT